MRLGIVVVGVILLILGAVMLFVPLSPQPDQNVPSGSPSAPGSGVAIFSVSGYSLTGNIPVSISWSAPTAIVVGAVACSGTCQNPSPSASGATGQTGTSGTFSLNQPNGGEIELIAFTTAGSAVTVTFKITTALTTVGSILLILGILLLIVGVVLKSKSRAPAPAAAPAATPPPATTEPPTAPPAQ